MTVVDVGDPSERSLKDTGERTRSITSGVREQAGKVQLDYISPVVLVRLGRHFMKGGDKYKDAPGGARNWEQGLPLSWFFNGLYRHTLALQAGLTDEDHAAAALWNIHCFIHTKEMIDRGLLPAELDDMPTYDLGGYL